jgi:hypothetical protein
MEFLTENSTVIAIVVSLNAAFSAVVFILGQFGKTFPEDSMVGKILKLIQGLLDFLSANLAHKKKEEVEK